MTLSSAPSDEIPVPAHIHYELVLQILEQVSLPALPPHSSGYQQLHSAAIHLRKALRLQKQFEEEWQLRGGTVEYQWSLNRDRPPAQSK
ncbi:DUF5340 domain-containing protein [Thermosynechococcus sp. B0]|uniref:DUF5340 domain-containing protein n=1 Tax=unclassified Thermosynechococcus TaxID=2622553 RepID=UPI002574F0A3|nr:MULTISPECIES: DUF5340 domain-containing protein [unclassified Thermosynechococcus]WJI25374.1 DUF5340 domain-containing protein [Thermosynechococcus sp. B0]WJI27507.1 DUF5340 domain-containing protein [Thermosynechococcus sp. B1]